MATAESTTDKHTLTDFGKEHDEPSGSSPRDAVLYILASEPSHKMQGSSCGPPSPAGLIRERNVTNMGVNHLPSSATWAASHHHPSLMLAHSSSTLITESGGAKLREVDADILELGVEEKRQEELADFDDQGRRLEASASTASLSDLDNEATIDFHENLNVTQARLVNVTLQDVHCSPEAESNDLAALSLSPIHSPSRLCKHSSSSFHGDIAASNSMPVINEDSTADIPHSTSDLSDAPLICGGDHEAGENNDYFIAEIANAYEEIINTEYGDVDHQALSRRKAAGRCHNRSDSFDRRMNESAQFAEAVGESSLLLNKIIEEDSSSDFDDDEIDEEANILQEEEILADYNEADMTVTEEHFAQVCDKNASEVGLAPLSIDITPGDVQRSPNPENTLIDSSQLMSNGDSVRVLETPQSPTGCNMQNEEESFIIPSTATTPATSPSVGRKQEVNTRFAPFTSCPPSYVDWKFTRQHSSSSHLDTNSRNLSGQLQGTGAHSEESFGYRGIRANPPEITQRGVSRGNYAQLHRKAWLEVTDKHHRYGKNLRMYYKHWDALGHPFHMFFDWLDSKGEAKGNPLPEIPELPRSVLDTDTVLYITDPVISASYALDIAIDPADGSAMILHQRDQTPIFTGKEGWIFILRDHVFYGSQKVTAPNNGTSTSSNETPSKVRQRFHHSSFFGGKACASAGIFITDEHGRMTHLYPHSGHYRPGEAHMQRVLFFFQQLGVELSTFDVDMQQIFKVSRKFAPKGGDAGEKSKDKENISSNENDQDKQQVQRQQSHNGQGKPTLASQKQGKKSKKTDCLHLMCGLEVACFLAHKALMIEKGVFHQIHKIRRLPHESRNSVCVILNSLSG